MLNKELIQFVEELKRIFNVDVDIKIETINTREEMDNLSGYKTPDWLVGKVKEGKIYIFSKEVYERVSSHKLDDYEKVLKHEIVHLFIHKSFGKGPAWFDEGVASILAEQIRNLPSSIPNPTSLISYEQFRNEEDSYAKSVKLVLNLLDGLNEKVKKSYKHTL